MPLQNRVTPFGDLVAAPERGMLMGNRGVLHDDAPTHRALQPGPALDRCLTEFKGRRRPLMAPGHYTELFFLDEATALAAGHRPCVECRRADAMRFRAAWTDANGHDPGITFARARRAGSQRSASGHPGSCAAGGPRAPRCPTGRWSRSTATRSSSAPAPARLVGGGLRGRRARAGRGRGPHPSLDRRGDLRGIRARPAPVGGHG